VVAGAATPQLSGCMRALWIELLPEGPRRVAAFALEAVLVEAVFLVGPALVAGLLALTGPAGVLLLVAAASASGTLGLAATSASRGWRGRAASAPETGPRLAGPLSSPAIRFVLVAAVLFGIGDGAVQVAVAGFAVRHGSERLAGLLLTALSVGSVAAGLVYGTRSWRWSWPARFAALNLLLGSALALAAPAMRAGWPPAVAASLLLGGLAVAPIATENSLLIGSAAPPGTVTEAFAWLVTAVVAGGAAGSAVAGPLLDRLGAAPTMLLAALPPIAVGVATSLCRSAVGAESEPRP